LRRPAWANTACTATIRSLAARRDSVHPDAYRNYLKARYHVLRLTRSDIDNGISYFRQAIDIDPTYALAYAGLADAYRVLALAGESAATQELPRAKAAAQRAIQIDETVAGGHAVLGSVMFWYDWNWNEPEKSFKRALQLDPNNVEALEGYAHLLSYTGRHAEALDVIRRSSEIDPLNLRTGALEGAFLINADQPDEALAKLSKTLELEPDYWFAQLYVAGAYIHKGMLSEAIEEARRAERLSGISTRPVSFLTYALGKAGRRQEARLELQKALKLTAERYVSPYNIALMYHGPGDVEGTLAWLERGFQQREPRMAFLWGEPKWKSLRTEPRFQLMLWRLGFTP
jgi:tetratricopeptide (TPR) repeat protein